MRRFLVGLACSFSVLCACGDDGGDSASDAGSTSGASNGTTTSASAGSTGDDPTTTQASTTADDIPPGSKMEFFGTPCEVDADCVPTLGADGKCLKDILGFYTLPGGYCSLLCDLPSMVAYVKDDPTCMGGGPGSYCIGADGYFEGCVTQCADDSQCPREGYECRIMPQLAKDGDPKFCLMTDEHMN